MAVGVISELLKLVSRHSFFPETTRCLAIKY